MPEPLSYGDYIFDYFPDGFTMQDLIDDGGWTNGYGYICSQDTSGLEVIPTFEIAGGTITKSGYYVVSMTVKLIDAEGNDVTDDYEIEYKKSYIKIYESELYVYSDTLSKTYDGTPLEDENGAYLLNEEDLQAGHKFVCQPKKYNSITNAGAIYNSYDYKIVDANGDDVTNLYGLVNTWGLLTVNKKNVEIEFASDVIEIEVDSSKKVLDQTDLSEYQIEGILVGHTVQSVQFKTQTFDLSVTDYVEVIIDEITIVVLDESGLEVVVVSNNYNFTSNVKIEVSKASGNGM